jgi:MFS family permease
MRLTLLYSASVIAGACVGVAGPLTPLLLAGAGADEMQVGLAASIMFAAIAVGALLMGPLTDRWGPKKGAVFGAALASAAMFLTPLAQGVAQLFLVRVLEGAGVGALVVCLEVAINQTTERDNRGATLGVYSLMFAGGVSAGAALGAYSSETISTPFWIAGALMALVGALVALLFSNPAHAVLSDREFSYDGLFDLVWGPLAAVGCYAMVEGAMLSLFPVYLSQQNFSSNDVGMVFSVYGAAAVVGPLVCGAVSDRLSRERLMLVNGVLLVISIVWLCSAGTAAAPIAAGAAAMGFATGALYPLGLGLIGDRVPLQRLGSANGLFTSSYGGGSILGPLIAGAVMRWFGNAQLFAALLAVAVVFVLLLLFDPFPRKPASCGSIER